jgi:hypothetical protein
MIDVPGGIRATSASKRKPSYKPVLPYLREQQVLPRVFSPQHQPKLPG